METLSNVLQIINFYALAIYGKSTKLIKFIVKSKVWM